MPKGIFKRKPISNSHRTNLSRALIGNKNGLGKNLGEANHKWNGGFNRAKYQVERNKLLKESLANRKRPNGCEICGSIGVMDFDHDHNNGKFRGWICRRCNLVLGMVRDSTDLLNKLCEYLTNGVFNNNSDKEDSEAEKEN